MNVYSFYLVWALIVLQCLDGISTILALKSNGHEANPIMRKLFSLVGPAMGLLLTKCSMMVALYIYAFDWPIWLSAVLVLFYVYVVINNLKIYTEAHNSNE